MWVMKMNKIIDLPLVEPLYSTYHHQGPGTAILKDNPTIRNWFLNHAVSLQCSRKFLSGFTTPILNVQNASWNSTPYFDKQWCSARFAKGYINKIIIEMLNQGYYVSFGGFDDYYIEGKSWYKERHFNHDGLICGYNKEDKTFCVYAYDSNWIYRKFWTPIKCFNQARKSMLKQGTIANICGLKVKGDIIEFSPETVCSKLKEYLDSNIKKYPFDAEGDVYGIVVHEYIAEYVSKLYDGSIPYERMDRRVFRLVWEHKKAMLERIHALENALKINKRYGKQYEQIVAEADKMRMLYASHHMRRRDSVLPIIREKLLTLSENEKKILTLLVRAVEKELKKNAMESSKK